MAENEGRVQLLVMTVCPKTKLVLPACASNMPCLFLLRIETDLHVNIAQNKVEQCIVKSNKKAATNVVI